MYFRHLYASVQPSLEQRIDSWENYCMLFNIILNSQVNMQVFALADVFSRSSSPCPPGLAARLPPAMLGLPLLHQHVATYRMHA